MEPERKALTLVCEHGEMGTFETCPVERTCYEVEVVVFQEPQGSMVYGPEDYSMVIGGDLGYA